MLAHGHIIGKGKLDCQLYGKGQVQGSRSQGQSHNKQGHCENRRPKLMATKPMSKVKSEDQGHRSRSKDQGHS